MLNLRMYSQYGKIPFSADTLSQAFCGPGFALIEMFDQALKRIELISFDGVHSDLFRV